MRLLPQKTLFFDLFDRQAEMLVQMCRELRDLLDHYDRVAERQSRIKDMERQCDQVTHDIATEMHASFVTPLDKEDITAIAGGMDDVADYTDAAAVRFVLYKIPEATPESRQLAGLLLQAAEVLQETVACLRKTKHRDRIIPNCRKIHKLENESDAIYREALGTLFNTPGIDPIFVLKWKEIYERLEMAVDQCEDVANVVESIQLKYS